MAYVSSIERIGIERGIQLGERKMLRILLESRFGTLPAWVLDKISSAPEHDLYRWGYALLSESSLEAIFNENQL